MTEQEIQKAVGAVLGFANEYWQPDRDEPRIIVEGNRWISPGTFGSDTGAIALEGDDYVVMIDADGDCPGQIVHINRHTFMLAWQ